jgi:hypothetical protein
LEVFFREDEFDFGRNLFECGISLELSEVKGAFVEFDFEDVSHGRGGRGLGILDFQLRRLLGFFSCSRQPAVKLDFVRGGGRVLAD